MSDLISRQAAIKNAHFPTIDDAGYEVVRVDDILALPSTELKTGAEIVPKEESDMYIAGYRDGHDDATKTGKWIKGDDYVCDYCGYHMVIGGGVYNYCPSRGKRMLE